MTESSMKELVKNLNNVFQIVLCFDPTTFFAFVVTLTDNENFIEPLISPNSILCRTRKY